MPSSQGIIYQYLETIHDFLNSVLGYKLAQRSMRPSIFSVLEIYRISNPVIILVTFYDVGWRRNATDTLSRH